MKELKMEDLDQVAGGMTNAQEHMLCALSDIATFGPAGGVTLGWHIAWAILAP